MRYARRDFQYVLTDEERADMMTFPRQYNGHAMKPDYVWGSWWYEPLASVSASGQLQMNRAAAAQIAYIDPNSPRFDEHFDRAPGRDPCPLLVQAYIPRDRPRTLCVRQLDEWECNHVALPPHTVRLTPQRPSFSWFSCSVSRLFSCCDIPLRDALRIDTSITPNGRHVRSRVAPVAIDWAYFARADTTPNVLVLHLPLALRARRDCECPSPDWMRAPKDTAPGI